jgi:hypothetical protein
MPLYRYKYYYTLNDYYYNEYNILYIYKYILYVWRQILIHVCIYKPHYQILASYTPASNEISIPGSAQYVLHVMCLCLPACQLACLPACALLANMCAGVYQH